MQKVIFVVLCILSTICHAQAPKDPKYCAITNQIKPNMSIGDVFLIMGPPHSFGQPPNLDMNALNAKATMQPQNTPVQDNADTRQRLLQSMANDPILGAFINAPPDSTNVLIWNFENNTLNVSVKVKGSTVTDVKTNFTCQ